MHLKAEGFNVLHAVSAEVALALVMQLLVSLITLDFMAAPYGRPGVSQSRLVVDDDPNGVCCFAQCTTPIPAYKCS
jgi:hypothetical protein